MKGCLLQKYNEKTDRKVYRLVYNAGLIKKMD